MQRSLACPSAPANFGPILGYNVAADMFFPAAIPLVAVVALVIWSTVEESRRTNSKGPKPTK
ncbi:MAG TPA: hypothetical protein VHP33_08085 [Polyangiaceae bacterium]|nr:hypothetical protein [Polyangiaceae bacterium]